MNLAHLEVRRACGVAVAAASALSQTSCGGASAEDTHVLQPGKNEQKMDVAFLTGGSYYGFQAFGGIIEWLEHFQSYCDALPSACRH